MSPHKKWLNRYPAVGEELTIWQFVAQHEAGLDRAIEFLNGWARASAKLESIEIVRYEDMRVEPESVLERVLRFFGADPEPAEVQEAVEYARFDNMRQLEHESVVAASGRRLIPGKPGRSDSYKVRRAKVGGWRDYFDEAEIAEIDVRVKLGLQPGFGYDAAEPALSEEAASDTERAGPDHPGKGRISA